MKQALRSPLAQRSLATLCACAALTLAAGCSRPDASKATSGASAAAAQTANSDIQTLVVGGPADFNSRSEMKRNVFDTFLQMDDQGSAHPGRLVSKVDVSADKTTYTFTLADGIEFHDGVKWDAKTAAWFFNWLQKGPQKSSFQAIASVKEIDGKTIEVKLNAADALFTKTLASDSKAIVPSPQSLETAWSETDKIKPQTWIGTGKFKVTAYAKALSAELERVNAQEGQGPLIDRIVYKVIPDDQASVAALRAGDVDIIGAADHHSTIPFEAVPTMQNDPKLTVEKRSYGRYQVVEMNTKQGPTADIRVRQALNAALDRTAMVKGLLANAAAPAWAIIPPHYPFAKGLAGMEYKYDPELAKKLLDEAGWKMGADGIREKDGKKLSLKYLVPRFEANSEPIAVYLQNAYKQIGVDVNILTMESGAAWEEGKKGNYDIYLHHSYGVPGLPEWLLTGKYHSKSSWVASLHSAELDRLIDAALKTHADEDYAKVYALLQSEHAMIPLYDIEKIVAYNKKVKNFTFPASVYAIDMSMIAIEP
ncbi:MAG: ABC transporter substrate-binding protein [Brachymonas sp.]|nr:ABC transporter substrate-binding protein [Brachymonas sp.]